MAVFGANFVVIDKTWQGLKDIVASKRLNLQYDENELVYQLFAIDQPIGYVSIIYKGEVPYTSPLTQEQNDANKVDFEENYKESCNQSLQSNVVMTSQGGNPVDIANNRMLVVPFPADFGTNLWLTGQGDDLENQVRGGGAALSLEFTGSGEQFVDIRFMEMVQLHDGQLFVQDPATWDLGDKWSLGVYTDANDPTPNPGNTGNCNRVSSGQGFDIVVPAASDGAYDIDLNTAVPVPMVGGFWDYDHKTNVLTPSGSPGEASWHLLCVSTMSYSHKNVPIPWHKHAVFDFDAYDAVRISPRWKIRWSVTKVSNGAGKVAGWIVVFRENIQ